MKVLSRRLGVVAALTLLVGCAGPGSPSSASADAEPGASTTAANSPDSEPTPGGLAPADVNWWTVTWTEQQTAAIDAIIQEFQAANPGVTVTVEQRDIDAHKEALRASLGTDAAPDIYMMWAGLGLGGEFVNAGGSQDLAAYYQQYAWDERFVAPALAAVTQYGGYHGVPFITHGQALVYNKALFEAAGVTAEPTTYEELVEAADKIAATGVAPIEFGGTVNWHVMRLLDNLLETACGAETHDQLKATEASWATTPCVTEAFTALRTWSDEYIQEDFISVDNDEASQLLYAGQAAMALEGDWFNSNLVSDGAQNPDDWGIFMFPTETDRLYSFTETQYIAPSSANQEQAAAFLDYLTSPEVQSGLIGTFGSTSVTNGVSLASPTSLDEAWTEVFAGSEGVFVNADQAFPLEITTEYWRIQNLVATGELDPAEAGTEFQNFIDTR